MPPDPRNYPGNNNIPLLSTNEYAKKVQIIQRDPNSYTVYPADFNPFDYRNLHSVRRYELAAREDRPYLLDDGPYLPEDEETASVRNLIAEGLGPEEIFYELRNHYMEISDIQQIFRRVYGTPTGVGKDETRRGVIGVLGSGAQTVSEIQDILVEQGWTAAEIQDILRGVTDASAGGRKSRKRSNKKSQMRLKNKKRKRTRNK